MMTLRSYGIKCHAMIGLFALIEWSSLLAVTYGKYSRNYVMPSSSSCHTSRIREIDGALITSGTNFLYSACIMKFEADDSMFTSKKIMIIFEQLEITDPSVSLKIYFASSSNGKPVKTLDHHTKSHEPLISQGKYVTLRLDKRSERGYNFKIVLTTFKTGSCSEFRCGDNKCIDDDLRCDLVTNCIDGSDEKSENCRNIPNVVNLFKIGVGAIIGIAIALLVCCLICVIVAVFCCRRQRGYQGTVTRDVQASTTSTTVVPPPSGTYPGQPPYAPTQPQYGQPGPPAYGPPHAPGQPAYGQPYPGQPYYPPGQPGYPPTAPPPGYSDPNYPAPVCYNVGTDQVKMAHV